MAHLNYPISGLTGQLLLQADLTELQAAVQGIKNFLDQNITGAYETLLSNIPNLASTNVGELRTAVSRYNALYAGKEIEHGNNDDDETPPGEPSPLLKEFGQYDISQVDKQVVTSGLFSNGAGTLTTFHTASLLGDTSASSDWRENRVESRDEKKGMTNQDGQKSRKPSNRGKRKQSKRRIRAPSD